MVTVIGRITERLSKVEKLATIEENMFDAGNICYATFKETGSLANARVASISYRCAMQAMRDAVRYHSTTTNV